MLKFITAIVITVLCSSFAVAQSDLQSGKGAPKSQFSTSSKKSGGSRSTKSKKTQKKSRVVADVADRPSFGDLQGLQFTQDPLELKSNVALVIDQENSQVLFEKNAAVSLPIASITKCANDCNCNSLLSELMCRIMASRVLEFIFTACGRYSLLLSAIKSTSLILTDMASKFILVAF